VTAIPKHRRTLFAGVIVAIHVLGLAALISLGDGLSLFDIGADRQIIEEPGVAADALVEKCSDMEGQDKVSCYQAELSERLGALGVRSTMDALDSLVVRDNDAARDAHVYAHHIGIEAYQLSPDVSETFSGCTESFSSGCYHGVIQAYFEDRGNTDADALEELCRAYKRPDQSRWILFQCVHGMGHGLTMYFNHHLPRALEACDLLGDLWDRESCYGGAFMENVMGATSRHHPATVLATETEHDSDMHAHGEAGHDAPYVDWKAIDPDDPHYPCSVMDPRYHQQCYLMQTSVMLHHNGGDLRDASVSCDGAPLNMRPTCHQSLGRSVTAYTKDPEIAAGHCEAGSAEYRGWCYVGVVKAFVDWTARAESGLDFCRVIEDDQDYKSMCYKGLGEEISALIADHETRASLCAQAEDAFVSTCRQGAQLTPG
jgi:hypothetical protein